MPILYCSMQNHHIQDCMFLDILIHVSMILSTIVKQEWQFGQFYKNIAIK